MENAAFGSGAPIANSPVPYSGGMRVLAVEEDRYSLIVLAHMLQRCGYQVTAKASPEEGLSALRENPEGFDLVMSIAHTQGPGIDGFELLKHARERYPVILFSGEAPVETVRRAFLGGACDFLAKPLGDDEMRNIWQHVVRRRLNAASGGAADPVAQSSGVFIRQDGTAWKRGSAPVVEYAAEGDSDGSQRWTAKKAKAAELLHASFVRAAEQLRGTEDYCPRGIRDLLEVQGVEVTIEQVMCHLEKYRRDCLTNDLSAMPMASSSHSIVSNNYPIPGSLEFYMRLQGAANINQTRLLSNGASPVSCGILGNENHRAIHIGHHYNNGSGHGNANGNLNGKYGNGYDYQYGSGNGNANANANVDVNGYHNGNGRGGHVNGSIVSASLPSNLAQQVHLVMPRGFGNGGGGLVADGKNLAQPVHQEVPSNSSFASSMVRTMDNPQVSELRYNDSTGGISMLPWPVDDGEDLLRSYLDENDVMQNTATADMTTQGLYGDAAAGQISASQPQGVTDFFSWEGTNGNGTSGESGTVADGTVEWELNEWVLNEDEIEKLFLTSSEYTECNNGNTLPMMN